METSCFRVFMLLNDMKAYVSMYFLHLMLIFFPQNDLMVNGPLAHVLNYIYEHFHVKVSNMYMYSYAYMYIYTCILPSYVKSAAPNST